MANTRSTIEIFIRTQVEDVRDRLRGLEVNLRRMASAVRDNEKLFDKIGVGIKNFGKALLVVGAVGNAVGFLAGLTGALVNLLPAALILPGALVAVGVALATFKLATAGFGDALKGDAEAMAKLAPSARETAKAIQGLKPAFDDLRKSVQEEFFKNFAGDVKNLASIYLPQLRKALPAIAVEFNRMGRSISQALRGEAAQDDIAIILTNTTKALGNMRQSLGHVVSGFIGLAAVGTDFLPGLGTAIDSVAFKFKHWVDQGIETGSIKASIEEALRQFRLLGDVAENIGGIIGAVFRGLSTGPQQDFLAALKESTQALEDFLNQADTQGQLGALGQAFADIAKVTREVFLEALRQLLPIVAELAPVFSEIARVVGDLLVHALQIVGPLLLGVAGFLRDNKVIIADLAPLVIGLWAAFKGATILAATITSLRALGVALGGTVAVLRLGGLVALGALAVKLDEINVAAAATEGRPLNDLEDSLHDLVAAGREIVTLNFGGIFDEIGSELTELHDKFVSGESPIGAWALGVKGATEDVVGFLRDAAAQVGEFFTTLPQKAGEVGTAVETAMRDAVTNIGLFFTETIPTKVSEGFESIKTAIGTGASDIGTSISEQFETARVAVVTKLAEIGDAIVAFAADAPHQIGLMIGAVIGELIKFTLLVGTSIGEGLTIAITTIQDWGLQVITFFQELPGRIGEALSTLGTTLATKAQEAGTEFLFWLSDFFTQTQTRAQEVPAQVGDAVSGAVGTLGEQARAAGAAFLQFLSDKLNEAVTFVSGVPGRVGAAISEVVGILGRKATEAGQSFINGVTTKFNEAVAFVGTIPGRLKAAIGDLGGLLVAAGQALMDGLGRGIKAGYQALLDFVDGIAEGIAAHKGPIAFDRTVLVPAGLALMDGLLAGLKSGNDDVQAFVAGIADQLADPFGTGTDFAAQLGSVSVLPTTTLVESARRAETDRLIAALSELGVTVAVDLDGEPVRAMVTSAVSAQDKDSARRLRAGSGASW